MANAQSAPITITIHDSVRQSDAKRFGINLGSPNYYDSGQMMKNLLLRNPGFEGEIDQSIVRCIAGSATSCTDEDQWSAWPAGFWSGASYEFIWGAAKGCIGLVVTSTAAKGRGGVFTFDSAGIRPLPGDYMIVRAAHPGTAQAGWWPSTSGSASITTEFADLSPHSPGRQAARLTSSQGSHATLLSYFDSMQGHTFLQMNGEYVLRFRAKGKGGANQLHISVARKTSPQSTCLDREVNLAPTWADYEYKLHPSETGLSIGAGEISFSANGSTALLDDVSLSESGDTNPTSFRSSVVASLPQLKPGLLRYWGGQLGDTLDNQIAPLLARKRSSYSAFSSEGNEIQIGLNDFLQLCARIGTEPYYVVPITFTPLEMHNLIEFLAGPAGTAYGKIRDQLGRREPWTAQFPIIHLQFGNEPWNSIFKAGNIEYTIPYANRADEVFQAAKNSPYYEKTRFDLVLCGQAVYVERNQELAQTGRLYDTLTVGPYLETKIDSFANNEELFAPLFTEPSQINSSRGYMGRNAGIKRRSGEPVRLSIYETNIDPREGSISQEALDRLSPSLGAGLGVIESMLMSLRDLGIKDQMFWSLPQYNFRRSDGKFFKGYGAVVDLDASARKRPSFLALQLANEAISGDMLNVTQNEGAPEWKQRTINGVECSSAKFIQAFAFSSGAGRSLILLNLHRESPLSVVFAGSDAPHGTVKLSRLHAADIAANNEDEQRVRIDRQTLANYASRDPLSLPPFSMTVVSWKP